MVAGYSPLELQAFLHQIYRDANGNPLGLQMQPYGYPLTVASLAPAGVNTSTVAISSNADFLLLGIRIRASIAAAAQTISNKTAPCVRMLVTDTGSGEAFTSAAVDLENYGGDANSDDGALPYPRLLQGRTVLSVQCTSYAAAETYAPLEIFFSGLQVRAFRSAGSPGVV